MSEWQTVAIGELCKGIYDGPHATPPKTNSGPVFLGISSLEGGRLDLSKVEHLSEDDYITWTRRVTPQADDIVFSYETRLGEAALIPEGLRCCLGRRMALMRPDLSKVDPQFLLFAYLSPAFQEVIRARTIHGSTVDRIALKEFPTFPIFVPPLAEQREIAYILGSLDDKIELNRQMNVTLEATAQAIFKSWFVDFDPVHAKANGEQPAGMDAETAALFPDSFEDSVLGLIPRGWRVASLDEIANFQNGLALQNFPPDSEDFLPVIKIRELRQGFIDDSSNRASTNIKESCIVYDGDILFSWSGSLMIDVWCGGIGALNQHLFKVTSYEYPKWFYYLWAQHHLDEFIDIAANKATTMGHIQRHHLSSAMVVIPHEDFIPFASQVIQPLFDSLINVRLHSRTLAELRDALLPRMISGEIRVGKAATHG